MAISIDSRRGRVALMVAHCAGMVDLVALPIWVGALISHYRFDPQQAGGLATLFLLGVVLASAMLAPRFVRLNGRLVAACGFGAAAVAFAVAARTNELGALAALHAVAGVATGAGLSVTHGTIARGARPHRLYAIAGAALGVFALLFVVATPQIMAAAGAPALFVVVAVVMAVASLVTVIGFPTVPAAPAPGASVPTRAPIEAAVWFGIAGIACMTVVQAMTFSFLERVGSDRGFERQAINGVLIALGLVNLLPAVLAALLEGRWRARSVLLAGPVLQALPAMTIMNATGFGPYAMAASVFAAVMIFTHTFAFGLLAKLEPSGRAPAATPAMLMLGSAIGPVLGGTLLKTYGYGSLGLAAVAIAAVAVFCFSRLPSGPVPQFAPETHA